MAAVLHDPAADQFAQGLKLGRGGAAGVQQEVRVLFRHLRPAQTVAAQARAGVDAVLHVARDGHGRHPVELAVPDPRADGFALLPALTWRPGTEATGGRTVEGPGVPALAARLAVRSGR